MLSDIDLCHMSAAAYSEAAEGWRAGDVLAVPWHIGDVTAIAFRGTVPSNAKDWVRDLDFCPTWRRRLGWCHRGFVTGAESVLPQIEKSERGRPLVFTGHSLGGAMALAAAALLVRRCFDVRALVTFGAPRVGGPKLRRVLANVRVTQYRNGNDPVSDVPWPYQHVRRLDLIGQAKLDPISAHSLILYAAALQTDRPGSGEYSEG